MGRAALMGTSHLWQTVPGQAPRNPKKGSRARRRPTANAALSIQLRKVAARATALRKRGAVRPAHVDAPCPASPPPRPAKGGAQAAKRPGGGRRLADSRIVVDLLCRQAVHPKPAQALPPASSQGEAVYRAGLAVSRDLRSDRVTVT